VFGWTRTKFPFRIRANKTLRINQSRVITVTGKAFFDIGYALKISRTRELTYWGTLHGKFTRS